MKRLLLPLVLLAAPLAAQDVNIPHTTFTLANGLRVIVAEDKSTPIAAVNVWYHVGSGYEQPGRTGFAHLFEHIMFEGSANVPEGDFDKLLEAAGGNNNGSTTQDRTNYYAIVPSNAVDLALWLEADRMGGLLQTMSPSKLDIQRDVVKNERRQSYENRPYGMLQELAAEALYPKGHPYSWSTIGSMDDLTGATLEDVSGFFRTYYVPNNAVLAVVGDVNTAQVREQVERYFGWIPRGPDVARPQIPAPPIPATRYITREDRVTLPQVNILWRTSSRFSRDEAAVDALAQILAGGKSSRLYQRLVYTEQNAQMVSAFNWAKLLSGDLFMTVRGKQGVNLNVLERAVMEEIARIAATPPSAEELQRVVNSIQTEFVGSLETVGGKADQLNSYMYYGGKPGMAAEDLARYRALTPADIQRVAREYLADKNRIVISFVPQGQTGLAVAARETAR
ncbi:MAG: insulinase family protein [Gemmatimonadetes bacterium]|nr:insulinase family protein [Gemmatimonadota bacterium]